MENITITSGNNRAKITKITDNYFHMYFYYSDKFIGLHAVNKITLDRFMKGIENKVIIS